MVRSLRSRMRRRGSIVPLSVLLLVPLLGLLAFTIDLGYIAWVATDLQTAADAAALAGAEKLQELYVLYTLPGQVNKAGILTSATSNIPNGPMATAEAFAQYNKAGNVAITMRDADITFGFTAADGSYQSNYGSYNGGFPNSITVVARRDDTSNTHVTLFFGSLFGFPSKSLTATATATIYSGDVTSLQAISSIKAHILPVALDMNIWTKFYTTGLSPDGTAHFAANGYPQIQVYPYAQRRRGSLGLLDLGAAASTTPAFQPWFAGGSIPNDISSLINQGQVPVTIASLKNWKAGPALTGTLLSSFQSQLNVPTLIPLFIPAKAPAGWQGQAKGSYVAMTGKSPNATYAVVGFAGASISQADQINGNMQIAIQPMAVVDPTAVIPNAKPVGTQTSQFGSQTMITTFVSAKLTQ